jgi:hypothetical protein
MSRKQLLEEIGEEKQKDEEKVELSLKITAQERIANIFSGSKPDYEFEKVEGHSISDKAIAYYLANGVDVERLNDILAEDEERAFLKIIHADPGSKKTSAAIFGKDRDKVANLRDFMQYRIHRSGLTKTFKKTKPAALRYVNDSDFLSLIAAQKLLEVFPGLQNANSPQELRDEIFAANISQKIDGGRSDLSYRDVIAHIKSEFPGFCELKDLLAEDRRERKGFFGTLFAMISQGPKYIWRRFSPIGTFAKRKRRLRYLKDVTLDELFESTTPIHHKAACLAELLDNPKDLRKIFSADKVYAAFNENARKFEAINPDFVTIWLNAQRHYHESFCHKLDIDSAYFVEAQERDLCEGARVRINEKNTEIPEYAGRTGCLGKFLKSGDTTIKFSDSETETAYIRIIKPEGFDISISIDQFDSLNYQGYQRACAEFELDLNEQQTRAFAESKQKAEKESGLNYSKSDEYTQKKAELDLVGNNLESIFGS